MAVAVLPAIKQADSVPLLQPPPLLPAALFVIVQPISEVAALAETPPPKVPARLPDIVQFVTTVLLSPYIPPPEEADELSATTQFASDPK
jgi:hypothetical protein